MIIDYNIQDFVVAEDVAMHGVANFLITSKQKIVFVINVNCKLLGVMTYGDILRAMTNQNYSNSDLIRSHYNKTFTSISESELDNFEKINQLLEEFAYIPVIDSNHHVISVVRRKLNNEQFVVDKFTLSKEHPSFIIAEIGNNHNGDIKLAKRLVELAKESGADCAKFQMRCMDSLYHKTSAGNLGEEYVLDLLDRFQLSDQDLFEVFDYCKEIGILPLCTPWDAASLNKLEQYGMPAYKVSSADLTNHEFLRLMAKTGKTMICSTGMATTDEIIESIEVLRKSGAKFVLLHCNSTYPTPFSDINLNFMSKLKTLSGNVVGYSGHERGFEVPIAAISLGAKVIEKHFTIDRSMEGNDHKVSLLPDEFKKMVKAIRNVEASMGTGSSRVISQGEMMNRVTLAKSLIINRDLNKGEEITAAMIETKSPGKGLQPNRKLDLIGRLAARDMKQGDFFYPSDLEDKQVIARNYNFPITWGVPVRYHDFKSIAKRCPDMKFVEFHLSYKDLEVNIDDVFDGAYEHEFAVHSPELFFGDHVMDLCSFNEEYRQHSINELRRVIKVTKKLKKYFPKTETPQIVVNVGGFTHDAPLGKAERIELYKKLVRSLSEIDIDGVEIIPQTMPPFPWHMGGQQFHNLFVDPDEIEEFCKKQNIRICFDVSHSGLACNHNTYSFTEFVDKVLPFTAHLHIADALGSDGEGMQVGEGNLDFAYLFKKIKENHTNMTFIPEIWQGHENDGEGFWLAFTRLEKIVN